MQVQCMKQDTQSWCSGTTQSVGWGRGGGGGFRMGGICVLLVDSCWYVAGASTVLWSDCPPIKINKETLKINKEKQSS